MADMQAAQERPEAAAAEAQPLELNEFQKALKREFRPRDREQEDRVSGAVRTLATQALAQVNLISPDVVRSIRSLIAAIDQKLTEQVNQIIHHPDYQSLEGTWRGLSYLVKNTETDEMLKIKILNVSKKDLSKSLERFEGIAWDQSPTFKAVYTEEYGMFGGSPYGCLIGDYYFDNHPKDVALLRNMSKIAAAAHTPFIGAAAPSLLNMESWQELMNPRDLTKIVSTPMHASWSSLRESEDARYIGLALPRVLGRLPYGANTSPVEAFAFEEDTTGYDHHKYSWMNAAYAMGVNINRSFKLYGWCSRIRGVESGGAVVNLPVHAFPTDDGGVAMKCPTEIAIDDRREAELAKLGLMPILHKKNTDIAAFIGAQSLCNADARAGKLVDPDAKANEQLSARMPYMFAVCRFAHYLKSIARDKIGSFKERNDMQNWLQGWINDYVDANAAHSEEEVKARKPLLAAEVVVDEVEGNPGYYSARFSLRPHYQLEGLRASLRLVSKLPSVKQA